ncbi:Copper-transporting ATPase RAN1 [Sesbania bispinosa]|nr:Copper-transporting ATPase RAN1 [Sesbania bispinosa]
MVATRVGANHGVLIKGGYSLERDQMVKLAVKHSLAKKGVNKWLLVALGFGRQLLRERSWKGEEVASF